MSPAGVVLSDREIIHALADDLPIGLWVARAPNGELIYANRAFAEIMGQQPTDEVQAGAYAGRYGIFTRDGRPYPEQRLPFYRAIHENAIVVVDDITIRRPDGGDVDVRAFARPVADSAGVVSHVIIAFIDITREAEAEKRLQRAQRLEAIGTLAGGIAHDFNNLIFGIKLIAADLSSSEPDPKRRAALEMIDDVTERSALLTRSLLGFARRGKHRAVLIALDDTIMGMRVLLERTLSSVTIQFDLGAKHRGSVIADQAQLEQVVMNLVVNARDALRDTSRASVRITTRTVDLDSLRGGSVGVVTPGAHVLLEVSDNGVGVAPEIRDRVFEPYFTTKQHGADRGTGLGLATVLGIVESHGGSIEITEGLGGRGTAMRVYLPAALDEAEAVRPRIPSAAPAGSGTILVIDDDAMVRNALVTALESLGYRPLSAEGGDEALAVYREHRGAIRAVLLDMIMPVMGGGQTFAALRELDPEVSVLLMSGYTINDDVQAILDRGARGFITKPYSIETLARSLAQIVQ
ncbi:MAG: Sensory box histidine kinase/response regulator [Myxococcales bacterium]|nr:Sensory box histidine kinase/response regulator [Myxococcales bacterium]